MPNKSTAYKRGEDARFEGIDFRSCPYKDKTKKSEWLLGWYDTDLFLRGEQ